MIPKQLKAHFHTADSVVQEFAALMNATFQYYSDTRTLFFDRLPTHLHDSQLASLVNAEIKERLFNRTFCEGIQEALKSLRRAIIRLEDLRRLHPDLPNFIHDLSGLIGLAEGYHFVMATSYHAFGRFIDYPYACSDGSPSGRMPEHDVIDEMMHGVADGIFAVDGIQYSVFSPVPLGGVNGDDTAWYYAHLGAYSFIIEVGSSFEPAFAQVAGIVGRNRGGWAYMYDRLGQARIDVHVADSCTGDPLEAEVTLTDYVYDTGELPRATFLPFGRWTYVVVANDSYTVRASKPGYVTQDVAVVVANEPVSVDIALEPDEPCAGPVPTVSQWGLFGLAIALATAACLVIRRRRGVGIA